MGNAINNLVFQPPPITYTHANSQIIWLQTKKGATIPAFYLDRRSQVTILFSHGNAEDLGCIYEYFVTFARDLNVNVLAYDYEGYGKASGSPSEEACYDDIDAAFAFLTDTVRIEPQNIVLYGRSLGTGPSCYLAERLHKEGVSIGGLVLQSPLLSVYRVAFNFRFTFPGDMFANVDRIHNIGCPLLVIHGTRDEIVPFWNGETLFLEAPVCYRAKPMWIEGAGHNDLETAAGRNRGGGYEHGEGEPVNDHPNHNQTHSNSNSNSSGDTSAFIDGLRSFLIEWVPSYAKFAQCTHRVYTSQATVGIASR